MKKMINNAHIEGYVFSHTLQHKVAQKTGIPYIRGELQIATDDQAMNVVTVYFAYVTEKYSKSKNDNPTFGLLAQLIEEGKTFETVGLDAPRVRVDGNLDVNDFYTRDGQLASPKRISGSFVHLLNPGQPFSATPATFEADFFIQSMILHDEYEDSDDYLELKGVVFDFKNSILPISLTTRMPTAIDYFQAQEMPMFTKVWGEFISTTIEKKVEVESAFGEPIVNVTTRSLRSWEITGAAAVAYDYPSENVLTAKELQEAVVEREKKLAQDKERHDEYIANRDGKTDFAASKPKKNQSPTATFDYQF